MAKQRRQTEAERARRRRFAAEQDRRYPFPESWKLRKLHDDRKDSDHFRCSACGFVGVEDDFGGCDIEDDDGYWRGWWCPECHTCAWPDYLPEYQRELEFPA